MRVLHAEPGELAELDRSIDRFWSAGGELAELGVFAADLALEPGAAADGGPLAVLRAREPSLRPLIERVLARVPRELSPRFTALQPRLAPEQALALVRARTGVDLGRATVRAGFARGHLIDVNVLVPGGRGASDEPAARELVRALVGEDVFGDWIGEVRVAPTPRGLLRVLDNAAPERSFPLAELGAAVDAAVRGLYDGLAAVPWYDVESEREYVVFELEVEPADDYPAQDDVVLVSTCAPEMLHCFLRDAPFSSRRFSRHGEAFAYLKYRAENRDLGRALEQRDALEGDLDAALAAARAGRVVGRGIGLRYAYLDLALSDLGAAVALLRARKARLPRESWLLFCDSHLGDEWIAIHDGAPLPPGIS